MISWTSDKFMSEVSEICQGKTYIEAAKMLSEKLGSYINPEQLRGAVRRYKARGNTQEARLSVPAATTSKVVYEPVLRDEVVQLVTFGAIADSHLCSNYERIDILESLYDIFQERGINTVYHAGNYIDGESSLNNEEIHVHGIDGQANYFVQCYPRRGGITTYYISGDDHEAWFKGIDMGKHVQDIAVRMGRDDLKYLGYMEADVPLAEGSDRTIRVLHAGGGSSYALTYTSQKIIDGYDDNEKPDILLIGHYHKSSYLPNYRGVAIWSLGCQQEQTPFMRKKRLHADLGGWIITVGLNNEDQIILVSSEFISYPSRPWRHRD